MHHRNAPRLGLHGRRAVSGCALADGSQSRGTAGAATELPRALTAGALLGLCFIALLAACGSPGEAEDPRSILGTELDGPEPEVEPDPLDRDATRAECQAAAKRMHELGVQIAVEEAEDAETKRRLQASAGSREAQDAIQRDTDRCVAERASAREARCFAAMPFSPDAATREANIERCAGFQ